MNTKTNDVTTAKKPRRELIVGGLAAIAALLVASNPFKPAPKKPEKIKFLSEDGQLIEIDASVIADKKKRKITNDELRNWIKGK